MDRVDALYAFATQLGQTDNFGLVQVKDERYILLKSTEGQLIVIYFVDSPLSNNAIKKALRDNTMRGIFSLFVLDEALLPADGETSFIHPFINTMQTLFHGKVYAYHVSSDGVEVFSVQLRSEANNSKRAVYDPQINIEDLACGHVETSFPMQGFWGTVNFRAQVNYEAPKTRQRTHEYQRQQQRSGQANRGTETLNGGGSVRKAHYDALGLAINATEIQIKAAYRRLARQYHPDLNDSPAAKERMQQINLAYKELMRQFD